MPARITRPIAPACAPDQAIANTIAAATRPNTSAPTGSSAIALGKTSSIRIAPKPAPPVTPITSGDASGLPSAPCSSAPATPSAAPTTIAETVRGSRSSRTICRSGPVVGLPGQRVPDVAQRDVDGAERQRGRGGGRPARPWRRRRPRARRERPTQFRRNLRRTSRIVTRRPGRAAAASCRWRRRRGGCATALRVAPVRVVAVVGGQARDVARGAVRDGDDDVRVALDHDLVGDPARCRSATSAPRQQPAAGLADDVAAPGVREHRVGRAADAEDHEHARAARDAALGRGDVGLDLARERVRRRGCGRPRAPIARVSRPIAATLAGRSRRPSSPCGASPGVPRCQVLLESTMLGLCVASCSRFGPSGCESVERPARPRSEARYWSLPPSVWPIATGRTPRRVMVEAANGVRAATRGAACAGRRRGRRRRALWRVRRGASSRRLGYPKNLC